jgi:hypothetical protein
MPHPQANDRLTEPFCVPATTDLYLNRHQFNWLQHTANHCLLYAAQAHLAVATSGVASPDEDHKSE